MQDAENTSAVFGLNWLQDMEPVEVTGAYDPEQEMWIRSGPVQAYGDTTTSVITTHNMTVQESTTTTISANGSDIGQDTSSDQLPDQDYDIDGYNGPTDPLNF